MALRIISWDVGIAHMAYCVLEERLDGSIWVLDWDEIDLIENDRTKLTCCGTTKDGRICGKSIKYQLRRLDQTTMGYCKLHQMQYLEFTDENQIVKSFEPAESDANCAYVQKSKTMCGKKAKCTSPDGISYCNTHYKTELGKQIKKYSIQPIKKISTNDYPTDDLQLRLVHRLDALIGKFARLRVSEVVIENQPATKNARMKAIAGTLYDYFLIRGYVDKSDGFDLDSIKYMAACNKLKVDADNTIKVFKKTKKKDKYKMTKQLGIEYTKRLLSDKEPEFVEYLEVLYAKKDDMCDAYLQGRYYLEIYRKKNGSNAFKKTAKQAKESKELADSKPVSVTSKKRKRRSGSKRTTHADRSEIKTKSKKKIITI